MESSEDDAGTATNASRRASAREKDVGLAEDVNATSSFHQEPSEARPTCETPAMSEDNFDGDSVPSPSAQDVNTSTEAILDMIDEIVDGPGAPKRLPLTEEDVNMQFDELEITSAHSNNTQESTKSDSENILPLPVVASPAESVKSEPVLPVGTDSQAESSITSDISAGIVNTDSVDLLPESSSVAEGSEPAVSTQPEDSALSSVVPESPAICPLPIPSSSEVQTVQNISVVSECESQERTVKCVTSSDSRDNVTVESAESTSSDSSVSEGKAVLVEPQVRSPLRRRLVRPAPSDRRPDSTVSSTVDSQIVNIPVVEETGSESITKDVTSSSDAVPTIHGNVKPEEIRNVSEINFCKAETSVSPPKKIKLIRQKVNTGTSNRNTSVDTIAISSDKDQCQSTSSESHSLPLPETITESSSTVSISKSQENNESIISVSNCVTEKPESPEQAVCSDQHSQPSIEQCHLPKIENSEKESNNEQELPVQSSSCLPPSPIPEVNTDSGNIEHESNILPATSTADQSDTKITDLEQDSASNIVNDKQEVTKDPESNETQIPSEKTVTEPSICPESSQISSTDSCKPDNSNILETDDQNKVPLIESNLSASIVPESKVEAEPSSIVTPIELNSISNLPESQEEAEQGGLVTPIEPSLSTITLPKSNEETEQSSAVLPCKQNSEMTNLPETNVQVEQNTTELPEEPNLSSTDLPETMVEAEQSSIVAPIESSLSTTTLPESKQEDTEESSVALLPKENLPASNLVESKADAEESTVVPQLEPNLSTTNLPTESTDQSNIVSPSKQTLVTSNLAESTETKEQSSIISPCEQDLPTSDLPEPTEIVEQSSVVSPCKQTQETSNLPESTEIVEQNSEVSPCEQTQITSNLPESTEILEQTRVASPCRQTLDTSNLPEAKETEEQSSVVSPCEQNVAASNLPESTDKEEKFKLPDRMPEAEAEQSGVVPPIKLNLSMSSLSESQVEAEDSSISKNNVNNDESEATKQVPKLTIKLKQSDEMKSPVPKLTIKPIKPPSEHEVDDKTVKQQQIPSVTKINIKPILKPPEIERPLRSHGLDGNTKSNASDQLPCITKLNIKPIPKPPEKINDIHRKSSSSEISESEYSENDESTSTSDQASASDQGSSDIVPKVTIKLGKPGTECEGKFYTEQSAPKLTIKAIHPDEREESESKLKLIISQSEDTPPEKIPKLTIKTVSKSESQPLSPKLTIKPIKPPDTSSKENEVSKTKTPTESFSSDHREGHHVPKITIKPVTRSSAMCDSPEHIPVVTKLNIKPILKPTDIGESSEGFEDKVPVVSKLNIKPVIKPKDNDVDSSLDDVRKVTKLNIKPIKNPEENSSEEKDCDELNADIDKNCIPVVTKLNIKPIIKPQEEETLKDSENQSSETGNSSDDNGDHIPVVTKLNIKPIIKPDDLEESSKSVSSTELSIPVVTKLNIKPLIKPGESVSPSSPKKEHSKSDSHSPNIPVVTKLNIKPVVRPEDTELATSVEEKSVKNPPLVMKINMKAVTENYNNENLHNEHVSNNVSEGLLSIAPKITKAANELQTKCENTPDDRNLKRSEVSANDSSDLVTEHASASEKPKQNCVPEPNQKREGSEERTLVIKKPNVNTSTKDKPLSISIAECDSMMPGSLSNDTKSEKQVNESHTSQEYKNINLRSMDATAESTMMQIVGRQKYSSVQNCTLLKKLLENKSDSLDKSFEVSSITNCGLPLDRNDATSKSIGNKDTQQHAENTSKDKLGSGNIDKVGRRSPSLAKVNDSNKLEQSKTHTIQQIADKTIENMTKPLEITISDKISNQSSGQDSPRIILKINKTDHGPSAKIITEEVKRTETQQNYTENTQNIVNDKPSPRKNLANSRRKQVLDTSLNLSTGKRLRSSRIVENTEKSPPAKRNTGKRSTTETSPPQNKESELSILQTKRLKLGQLLSNKSLTITPVTKTSPPSPTKTSLEMKQGVKSVNHTLLNNENCSKNGNSKLHNILSNLQAKQMQFNNTNCSEKAQTVASDIDLNASMSSSDAGENTHVENSRPAVQEMIIAENTDFREFGTTPEEVSQDPLEVDSLKPTEEPPEIVDIPKPVELTPQPKKRGRPRKLPVSEGAKPAAVTLPVPALEERPQRSLRLMRDRPAILSKPRGRGRGRGGRRSETTPPAELETVLVIEPVEVPEERPVSGEIDPTSSRIKLPRMTEALDKMPSTCNTPLSSRRRNSSGNFSTGDTPEKTVLDNSKLDEFGKSPEPPGSGKSRGGRGARGGRGRTPRARGRGRGGGRGAMYMKETMGIYGRVCGPATTTVQLFEEETCMMDDNATPAKPSHLLDEDSQSSVKSSTNESSNKLKKSKFADLFDSNKVWTAADVKEYTWPPPDKADVEHKVMMIQEQVAMFLGVKSFKRRYAELNRRTITGEERDYVLSKGLVTEALCDLGITAVDASDVLDIMLSDYPHKYEEFRSHQRQRQLAEAEEEPVEEAKVEEKVVRIEMKPEKPAETKPEPPKVDPEKTRQDMAAAAIASASEWNARANAARRGACADLQSLTVQRARAPQQPPPAPHLRPPAGFYPHALLPGQYQHSYRVYTPDQLRYFPLNTVLAAPPAPASEDWSSESEPDWGSHCSSSDDSDGPSHHAAKRKKLTKTKRSSQAEASSSVKEEPREEVDLCRVCKLRLEANRRYTHERFLVCANCNAKLHPSCLELSADTIRKCREYAWQCAECKSCCSCRQPADDDKMLFCDLCDRGFHIYCVGLDTVPSGRWHCVECAICKSCGARSPGGPAGASGAAAAPADWHHQTRRGPGGHKVYSHSLCTPCARAYRIGRYCPLCERSFIGPKGTMQLVICKLCDRQLHQECVRQTGCLPRVLDYTCGGCRRGGITSRAAAVRLAPRTIATLFMAKRRFNKYAHRQYLASRLRPAACPPGEAGEPASDDERDASDPLDAADLPEHTASCS